MRNKNKRRCGIIATVLVLLALSASPAAHGQLYRPFSNADGFFSIADGGLRDDGDVTGNQEATWEGMKSNATPVGGGLLVLTAAGLCYAGAKKVKRVKSRE
ncbi:MAG: hypothetical protein KBT67_09560 [bacterium]|nr:hypothetical protein [Candidatus Limimorpha caballi]